MIARLHAAYFGKAELQDQPRELEHSILDVSRPLNYSHLTHTMVAL